MSIKSQDGYVFLSLPVEAFSALPETITVHEHDLTKKKEFHVTLVHATSIPETELTALITDYIKEHPISFVSFTDDLRLAQEPGRTSVAARCTVTNLEGLFDRIEAVHGIRLPLQPAHVSLYVNADRGVGIDSEEQWQSHEKLELPELARLLRGISI